MMTMITIYEDGDSIYVYMITFLYIYNDLFFFQEYSVVVKMIDFWVWSTYEFGSMYLEYIKLCFLVEVPLCRLLK